MLDTEIKNSPYIDLRLGVKFYFYKNPINCKKAIKEIFDSYCNITRTSFIFYRYNMDEGLKCMKKENTQFFNKIIDKSSFSLTEHIILTDATREKLQSIKCEMMLCNHEPAYALRLPNQMYFEFSTSICYEEIFQFIRFACKTIKMHYCICNPLFGVNDHYANKGNSCAVKQIQKQMCLSDKYSVFENPDLLKNLETKIDRPNAIQVLSDTLYKLIGREKLIGELQHNHLYYEVENDYIIIALSKEKIPKYDEKFIEFYRALSEILKDIILDMKKPQMYWKPDEWDLWKNRVKIIPNSFNCC